MRYFTIQSINHKDYKKNLGGRYVNDIPLNAAKKAFNHILRDNKSKQINFTIEMRETTRNSDHKIYKYDLTRIRKNNPISVTKNGTKITYNYDVLTKDEKKLIIEAEQKTQKLPKDKSKKYECSKEEKENKLTNVCCSKFNSLNERTYKSCKKHILTRREKIKQ